MATRYPLVLDTSDNNKIKEIPSGDNLNLSGNNIVNALNITASGTLTINAVVCDSSTFTINGQSLDTVAFSGSYTDLDNRPTLFSGSYVDLTDKPTLKTTIESLDNVGSTTPTNGQALIYNTSLGRYEPGNLPNVSDSNLTELSDVSIGSLTIGDVLRYTGGVWTNSNVDFSELTGTDDVVIQGDTLTGDLKGSVFADDSSLLVDAVNGTIPGYISIAELQTAVQDGAGDFAAFKAYILAL